MPEITFESYGSYCKIEAPASVLEAIKKDKFTHHYMIGAREVKGVRPNVTLIQDDSANPVRIDYPVARFNSRLSTRDIVVVGEYLLERARQENSGLYTVSSACAAKEGLAVTFYGGATNLGKTSSMMTLVERCGFHFISDEKTLLNLQNGKVAGGSFSVPTRKKRIRQLFFKGKVVNEYEEFVQVAHPQKAALMVYPHLDHGLKKPIFYKWKPLDFFWLLTRDLSHEIRGGIRLVDNFNFLLPSIDTEELTSLRTARTKEFCNAVSCFYFQGSLDQVAEYIPRFLEEENA